MNTVIRASDMRLSDWRPECRFRDELTGMSGRLQFDKDSRPWLITGKIGSQVKVKLESLVLEVQA